MKTERTKVRQSFNKISSFWLHRSCRSLLWYATFWRSIYFACKITTTRFQSQISITSKINRNLRFFCLHASSLALSYLRQFYSIHKCNQNNNNIVTLQVIARISIETKVIQRLFKIFSCLLAQTCSDMQTSWKKNQNIFHEHGTWQSISIWLFERAPRARFNFFLVLTKLTSLQDICFVLFRFYNAVICKSEMHISPGYLRGDN